MREKSPARLNRDIRFWRKRGRTVNPQPQRERDIETALTVALIAAAVGLAGVFAAHRLSLHRDNNARLLAARAGFRVMFNTDIAEVANPSRLPEIYAYLAQRFPKHDAAVRELSAHLPRRQRRRLAKDWEAYGKDVNELRQRYNTVSGHPEADVRRQLAVDRLKKLLFHGEDI